MADLALSQMANRCTENLTQSEYRRLMIGVQLIKDPSNSLLLWFFKKINLIDVFSNSSLG